MVKGQNERECLEMENPRLEKPRPGLIKQEVLTYEKKDGKIWITTETRNYQGDDDYIDSWKSECIGGLK